MRASNPQGVCHGCTTLYELPTGTEDGALAVQMRKRHVCAYCADQHLKGAAARQWNAAHRRKPRGRASRPGLVAGLRRMFWL